MQCNMKLTHTDVADILAFDDIGANVDGATNGSKIAATEVETGESSRNGGEVLEEEIVELEFEKLKPKLATHTMHCPNCKSEITKVTLRRKILSYRPPEQPAEPVVPESEPEQIRDEGPLVGCLSCLSLFTCSDNGCFRPFDIFRKRVPDTTTDVATPPQTDEKDNNGTFEVPEPSTIAPEIVDTRIDIVKEP
ncbi:uncharacterized protein LOC143596151, partial [Bidens hawaiensis]|uniref:uncharacterized protein LOC143596151 n=1 Tax=Bidens hawaiensis TaxID=980011 RepID=UPI004049A223